MSTGDKGQRHHINRKLREKLHNLMDASTNFKNNNKNDEKRKIDLKIRLLADAVQKRKDKDRDISRGSVFISFSKTGKNYFRKASELCKARGFIVNTGFDDQSADYVLKVIKNKIKESTLFLSIMTPEHKFDSSEEGNFYAPSIWLSEEKGMALALEKPFRLLVHARIKHEFWKKTTPSNLHSIFDDAEFEEKLSEAVDALERRYQEILEIELQDFARRQSIDL